MRIIAILAAYNEERFIEACLENYARQGLEVYLIDNGSTDRTLEIAERHLGRTLVGIEEFPRGDVFDLRAILERKEEVATELDADWFLHADPDEIRLPSRSAWTLAEELAEAEAAGYNAVNFFEFTFAPTCEAPDHDHPDFQRTMRWYYPFQPFSPHQLKAWKRQPEKVELAWGGGHQVRFPGLSMCPRSCPMRHYLYLSADHAVEKYVRRPFDPRAVARGWHGGRATLRAEEVELVSQSDLRPYVSDDLLDVSEPRTRHPLFAPKT